MNYFWLSIEGTDAVGKTKLLKELEKFLRISGRKNQIFYPKPK